MFNDWNRNFKNIDRFKRSGQFGTDIVVDTRTLIPFAREGRVGYFPVRMAMIMFGGRLKILSYGLVLFGRMKGYREKSVRKGRLKARFRV